MGTDAIAVRKLWKYYGDYPALREITLDIAQGACCALLGRNGAGKTTLLRTISGLLRPKAGSISWQEDRPIQSLRPDEIVRLGISHVPEGRQVFANMTVRENLALGAYQRNDKPEIQSDMDRCYTLFPVLAERREQRSGTLSGGEQQMLVIGRALMARPQLLLLDEPSLGLAPLIIRKIFQIIREINAEGTTVFLVEQNAHMALATAHRGYVLQTGRVIKTAAAKDLLADPEVKAAYLGG